MYSNRQQSKVAEGLPHRRQQEGAKMLAVLLAVSPTPTAAVAQGRDMHHWTVH